MCFWFDYHSSHSSSPPENSFLTDISTFLTSLSSGPHQISPPQSVTKIAQPLCVYALVPTARNSAVRPIATRAATRTVVKLLQIFTRIVATTGQSVLILFQFRPVTQLSMWHPRPSLLPAAMLSALLPNSFAGIWHRPTVTCCPLIHQPLLTMFRQRVASKSLAVLRYRRCRVYRRRLFHRLRRSLSQSKTVWSPIVLVARRELVDFGRTRLSAVALADVTTRPLARSARLRFTSLRRRGTLRSLVSARFGSECGRVNIESWCLMKIRGCWNCGLRCCLRWSNFDLGGPFLLFDHVVLGRLVPLYLLLVFDLVLRF